MTCVCLFLINFSSCFSAYDEYKAALARGDDGKKPDWEARKTCIYFTEIIEVLASIFFKIMIFFVLALSYFVEWLQG